MATSALRADGAAAVSSLLSPTPRACGSTGTPVFAKCPDNDDESERRQRRRSRAVDSSLEGLRSPLLRSESWRPPLPQWSNAQISEHYSTCIKLSTENKITTKNAFGLHLIDYMSDILKENNSELTNFQLAAGTLDASAKIYAMRVDAVHADTFRMLADLGNQPAPARDPDSPEEDSSPAPEAAKIAQPRKKQGFKTIEENLSNINVSEASRRPGVDPMFQRELAYFDESNTVGMFMTRLRSQNFQNRLLFPSQLIPLPSSESLALPSTEPVTVPGLKDILTRCVEKRPISSLAGFRFTNWDEETHDKSVSALLEKFQKSDQVFNPNLDLDSEDEEGCAPSPPEFQTDSPDGDGIQEFQENSGDSLGAVGRDKRSERAPFGQGDVTALSQRLSLQPREYSYFSPRTLAMWAGPEHWRLRPPPDPKKDSRPKAPKKVFELDFTADIDFQPYFRKTKAPTTLSKSTLRSHNVRNTTLPEDFDYDPRDLSRLFLKPEVEVSMSSDPVGGTLDDDAGIEDYDYDNPNDTSNFCPALEVSNSDDDPDPDPDPDPVELPGAAGPAQPPAHPEAPEPSEIEGNVPACGELELIPEPQRIRTIPIQYAKTAKPMDVRRLKRGMWELLTEQGAAGGEEETKEETDTKMVGEKHLSDVINDLRRRLPPAMAANLTVPLAFLCLLHLANEKNLTLENTEDLSDVVVKQNH